MGHRFHLLISWAMEHSSLSPNVMVKPVSKWAFPKGLSHCSSSHTIPTIQGLTDHFLQYKKRFSWSYSQGPEATCIQPVFCFPWIKLMGKHCTIVTFCYKRFLKQMFTYRIKSCFIVEEICFQVPEGKTILRQNKKIGKVWHTLLNDSLLSLLFPEHSAPRSPSFLKICILDPTFTLVEMLTLLKDLASWQIFKRQAKRSLWHTKGPSVFGREFERRKGTCHRS